MKFLAVAFAFILFVQLADVRVDNFSSFFCLQKSPWRPLAGGYVRLELTKNRTSAQDLVAGEPGVFY